MRRDELETRLDSHFHLPRFRNLIQTLNEIGSTTLGALSQYSEEKWDKLDGRFIDVFPYIEISGVGLGTNEYQVSRVSVDDAPSRAQQVVRNRDILVSLTRPSRGAVANVQSEHDGAIASTGFAVVREVDSKRVSREYLTMCLTTPIGSDQMLRRSSGGNYPAITREELSKVLIPDIAIDIQRRLLADVDAARAERKAKLAQADALLAGIDDFVLDTLGIVPPQEEARRVFAMRPSQVGGEKRLNAEYYHPERTRALSALQATSENLTSRRLMEVVNFEREQLKMPGENYLSLAHVQGNTGELTDATDTASGNCLVFQTDDVLFARLRPYLNKVYRADMNGCCSTEFQVLRVKDSETLLPEYLAAVLRSRIALAQTVHMMTGNTHPRLTNYDVATLTIPIPSMDVQNVIATEAKRHRNEARRLRAEAETGWEAAKARFEARLLGLNLERAGT